MKLPVHVLRRIDYYEARSFIKSKKHCYVTIYWKPVKKKFLWWTVNITPSPKTFKFDTITKWDDGSIWYYEPEAYIELKDQLHDSE